LCSASLIASEIQSAKFITVSSLVVCKTRLSRTPETFTIPVINISPTGNKVFFTPKPGVRGPFPNVIYPRWFKVPSEASIAMIKGFE
jgi:hypothetical protein